MKTSTSMLSAGEQASGAIETNSLFVTVSGTLVLIILVMIALAWLARRSGLTRRLGDDAGRLTIVATKSLGNRERVVLLDIGDERLVLGVTAAHITCLTVQERPVSEICNEISPPPSFAVLIDSFRQRYQRKR